VSGVERVLDGVRDAFLEHARRWDQIHAGALKRFAEGRTEEQRVALSRRRNSTEQALARAARALRGLPPDAPMSGPALAASVAALVDGPGRRRWATDFARAAWHRVRAEIAERPDLPATRQLPSGQGPGAWSVGGDASEVGRALLVRLGRGLPLVDLWRGVAWLSDSLCGLSDPRTEFEVRALATLLFGPEQAFGLVVARGPGGPAPLLFCLARNARGVQLDEVAVTPRECTRLLLRADGLAADLADPTLAVDYITRVAPWFGRPPACAVLGMPEVGAEQLRREFTAGARDHGVGLPEDGGSDDDLVAVPGIVARRPTPGAAPWFRIRNLVLDQSWCDGAAWDRLWRVPGRRLGPGGSWCGSVDLVRVGDVTDA
jgi:hypothetical protein